MRIKILALSACLMLPFQMATADIAADFKAGLKIPVVMSNAITTGMSIEESVTKMIEANPKAVLLIVKAAIEASPESAKQIVAAAILAAPKFKDQIASAAIDAGANPTDVIAATAAGSLRAITTVASTPAPGSGGGEVVASPN